MKPSPAFQFYAQDFLVGTADMTPEEVGGYVRLLCYQWCKGSIPDNEAKLLSLSGCTCNALATIMHKFCKTDAGGLQNSRMEEVRAKQREYQESRASNAKKGWKHRIHTSICNAHALHTEDEEEVESPIPSGGCKGGLSLLGLRICKWFHRRPETKWKPADLKKLYEAELTPDDEVDMLEAYYLSPLAEYKRKDISTLLNNWASEIDRARAFKANPKFLSNASNAAKPNPRNVGFSDKSYVNAGDALRIANERAIAKAKNA